MRIAMVGSRGVPARYGGVETAVQELSVRLAARGHEVTVYCRAQDYQERAPQFRGVHCRYIPTLGGKHGGTLVHAGLSTADALWAGYDVVHFHAMGPTLFAPMVRLRHGTRVVATVQGRDDLRDKWGPAAQRLMRTAAWSSARVPHQTIVVSQALQQDYAASFGRETVYLPNGISPVGPAPLTFAGQARALATHGLVPGRYLLNVGRLVPEKALDVLFRAYRGVPGNVPLAVAGSSSHTHGYVARLRRLAADDSRVRLLGPVFGDELDSLFRNAVAFVQPSSLEGLPLVLLEAAAYGLPAVVSDIAPHLEIVGGPEGGAITFPTGDVGALTSVLTDVVGAERSHLGQQAKRWSSDVLRRYDWEPVVDRTEQLYRSLL